MADAIPTFPFSPLQPGGYSVLDASALTAASQIEGAPVVAVVGDAKGSEPNKAIAYTNLAQLRGALRGAGAGYDTARAAFIGGASSVIFVRAGAPTRSTKALAGAADTPVTLTSKDWGAATTAIKVTVGADNLVTVTATDLQGVLYTEQWALGADATAQQIADAINGQTPGVTGSQFVTATVTEGTMPLTAAAAAALAGGSDPVSLLASDYTAALAVLETEEVDLVVAATGDATVHAQVVAHCNTCSAVGARHERRTVEGGVLGEDTATAAARMTGSLLDKRFELVYPGISLFDDTGNIVLYPPYVNAGYTAGKWAAQPDVATSLVHVACPEIIDVERRLSKVQGGDLDVLLAAGVTPIEPAPGGGFRYTDALSGYRADYSFRDFHKIATADYASRRLRDGMDEILVGRKTDTGLVSELTLKANGILEDLVTEGILVAHGAPTVTQDPANGAKFYATAPVVLPDTGKFVLLTVALQPPAAAASLSTTTA